MGEEQWNLQTDNNREYKWLINKKEQEVIIEDNVWLGYGVKVLKGVRIGKNSLIGANSVVTKDVPEGSIVAGNPARIISTLDDWKIKINNEFDKCPHFSNEYTMRKNVSKKMKSEMLERIGNGTGYIEWCELKKCWNMEEKMVL